MEYFWSKFAFIGGILRASSVFLCELKQYNPAPWVLAVIVGCTRCKNLGHHDEEEISFRAKDVFLDLPSTVLKIGDPDYPAEVSNLGFADAEVAYH